MSNFKTIDDIDVRGKKVLVRADLNVPMRDGVITDATRIERTIPTLLDLIAKGATVIILSHFGRPKGEVNMDMSLYPICEALSSAVGQPVSFGADCVGAEAEVAIAASKPGDVILLENLRFHPEEKAGDEFFAGQLAENGDVYVNDAFGTAHRAHASTAVIAKFFP
ncbi:MAG: phosphoglycerate kinase, partial [Rhodospirillales bacterium]|nr:phosphoglycerate kinase [Rhodospirillales bacterium]